MVLDYRSPIPPQTGCLRHSLCSRRPALRRPSQWSASMDIRSDCRRFRHGRVLLVVIFIVDQLFPWNRLPLLLSPLVCRVPATHPGTFLFLSWPAGGRVPGGRAGRRPRPSVVLSNSLLTGLNSANSSSTKCSQGYAGGAVHRRRHGRAQAPRRSVPVPRLLEGPERVRVLPPPMPLFFVLLCATGYIGVPCKTHLIVPIARGYVCGQLPRPTTK